jgi:two-component system chemotaxis sensor kinase CheA
VITTAGQKVGLLVERLHREADVLLKPMDGLLAEASVFSGTTLLGDGLVLLVLDVREVLRHDAGVA